MGRRFLRYIDRHFSFVQEVEGLTDTRVEPTIALRAIFLSVFLMFACRRRSLNALESEFRDREKQWPQVIGKRLPSADRMGEVMDENVCADELRQMHERFIKRAHRMKALPRAKGCRWRVGSVDAHELFATRHRRCPACLERWVMVGGQMVLEYYHRVVVFEIVSTHPGVLVDLEPIGAGEDEVAAAQRLAERVLKRYPQICDVVVADGAYQEAPFFRKIRALGKHVVAVLKDERRELFKDADGMLRHQPPGQTIEEEHLHRGKVVRRVIIRLWDFTDLETWPQLGSSARVIRCVVETTKRTKRGTQWVMETTENCWWWATTLTPQQAGAEEIMRMGRRRWVEENSFNELVCHWAMDHRFKHEPNAIVTFLLTLFIAHFLQHLFYARGLQPEARLKLTTCLALAEELHSGLSSKTSHSLQRPP